ncbi:hypothetical protein CYMTET_18348 [Cymbomonas tetramitiformis]|uniref:Uncharacterized protein n=1 Tax=Cymbomonas tetramitiformis TaxID=36881 RepID=A0AAE0L603_9CHLO|nr:hypothetical protein CYMTET_18348 [Cymbomonas tetramitiformis]
MFVGEGCVLAPTMECLCTHLTDFKAAENLEVGELGPPDIQAPDMSDMLKVSLADILKSAVLLGCTFGIIGFATFSAMSANNRMHGQRQTILTKLIEQTGNGMYGFKDFGGTWTWSLFEEDRVEGIKRLSERLRRMQRNKLAAVREKKLDLRQEKLVFCIAKGELSAKERRAQMVLFTSAQQAQIMQRSIAAKTLLDMNLSSPLEELQRARAGGHAHKIRKAEHLLEKKWARRWQRRVQETRLVLDIAHQRTDRREWRVALSVMNKADRHALLKRVVVAKSLAKMQRLLCSPMAQLAQARRVGDPHAIRKAEGLLTAKCIKKWKQRAGFVDPPPACTASAEPRLHRTTLVQKVVGLVSRSPSPAEAGDEEPALPLMQRASSPALMMISRAASPIVNVAKVLASRASSPAWRSSGESTPPMQGSQTVWSAEDGQERLGAEPVAEGRVHHAQGANAKRKTGKKLHTTRAAPEILTLRQQHGQLAPFSSASIKDQAQASAGRRLSSSSSGTAVAHAGNPALGSSSRDTQREVMAEASLEWRSSPREVSPVSQAQSRQRSEEDSWRQQGSDEEEGDAGSDCDTEDAERWRQTPDLGLLSEENTVLRVQHPAAPQAPLPSNRRGMLAAGSRMLQQAQTAGAKDVLRVRLAPPEGAAADKPVMRGTPPGGQLMSLEGIQEKLVPPPSDTSDTSGVASRASSARSARASGSSQQGPREASPQAAGAQVRDVPLIVLEGESREDSVQMAKLMSLLGRSNEWEVPRDNADAAPRQAERRGLSTDLEDVDWSDDEADVAKVTNALALLDANLERAEVEKKGPQRKSPARAKPREAVAQQAHHAMHAMLELTAHDPDSLQLDVGDSDTAALAGEEAPAKKLTAYTDDHLPKKKRTNKHVGSVRTPPESPEPSDEEEEVEEAEELDQLITDQCGTIEEQETELDSEGRSAFVVSVNALKLTETDVRRKAGEERAMKMIRDGKKEDAEEGEERVLAHFEKYRERMGDNRRDDRRMQLAMEYADKLDPVSRFLLHRYVDARQRKKRERMDPSSRNMTIRSFFGRKAKGGGGADEISDAVGAKRTDPKELRRRLRIMSVKIRCVSAFVGMWRDFQDLHSSRNLCELLGENLTSMSIAIPIDAMREMVFLRKPGTACGIQALWSKALKKQQQVTQEEKVLQTLNLFGAGIGGGGNGKQQGKGKSKAAVELALPLERMIGTALVLAFLDASKIVIRQQVEAQLMRASEVSWERPTPRPISWYTDAFMVMLTSNIKIRGWYHRSTLWNLVFLQNSDGSFNLTAALATILAAGNLMGRLKYDANTSLDIFDLKFALPYELMQR